MSIHVLEQNEVFIPPGIQRVAPILVHASVFRTFEVCLLAAPGDNEFDTHVGGVQVVALGLPFEPLRVNEHFCINLDFTIQYHGCSPK